MKPGPLLRGSPRLTATARTPRHAAARALLARAQPSASALQPSTHRARNSLPQPCTNSQHIAHPFQHLPSIPSHGIARALPCARARLPGHVPPRRNVGLPRPRLTEAQPCLSTCALPVRQSASVLMLRVRSQCDVSGQLRPMGRRPHVHAQRTQAQAFVCRDARMHAHISHVLSAELQQSIAGLFCRQYELSCIAGTHVLQAHMHCSTPWADAMLLWICTQSCKSGAGMDTTLKWNLARASDQGDYTPLHPVS